MSATPTRPWRTSTAYTYLVNEHWRAGVTYPALNLADETVAIAWPIPLDSAEVEISDKDLATPRLADVTPMAAKKTLIIGGERPARPRAAGATSRARRWSTWSPRTAWRRSTSPMPAAVAAWPWHEYATILNAAAYTAVDAAETDEGRVAAWAANATAPATLARVAAAHNLTLVHYSSDYVFDGTAQEHTEDEPLSPLGVYGTEQGSRVIWPSPRRRATTSCVRPGSSARATTSSAPWRRSLPTGSPPASSTTRSDA
ncbi:MAG: sugar nucleotide-binding protein [Nocardioides sp.]